ncbi:MAG: hypothetical protein K0R78_2081 [Pelosinus sp.]|jgi:hypothetical protein|nr:hypothetical protein [Pelosinus sp.]
MASWYSQFSSSVFGPPPTSQLAAISRCYLPHLPHISDYTYKILGFIVNSTGYSQIPSYYKNICFSSQNILFVNTSLVVTILYNAFHKKTQLNNLTIGLAKKGMI